MKGKRRKKIDNVRLESIKNNEAPRFSFENNPGDNRRRFDNTRRVKLEIQKLKREEFLRQMRLEDRRNEFSDEEWDAMREESLRLQAERGIFIPPVKNKEEDDDERGQSDFYSGLDYQSDSIHDVSQNFATLRRENGKFGSHPNEDSYGEESRS